MEATKQDCKAIFKPDTDHPLTAEHVGWMATLKNGQVFGPLEMDLLITYPVFCNGVCWTSEGRYWHSRLSDTRDIDFVSPPEVPSQLAEASEEAKEPSNSVDIDAVIAICREAADGYKRSEENEVTKGCDAEALKWQYCSAACELIKERIQRLASATASRDDELRRLREELQSQRAMADSFCKRAAELASEKANLFCDAQRIVQWIEAGAKSASTAFTEGPDRNVAYAIESKISAANEEVKKLSQRVHSLNQTLQAEGEDTVWCKRRWQEQVEKLRSQLTTLERHYSEARGLVEKQVPMTSQLDGVSFLESLYDGVRYNCNWHNAHYDRITKTFACHDQERAACKPCGEPLTHSEAEKICAGETVRQGEDLAAQVEQLQAENKLLSEQQKLAYNWLPRRDKEMFDQKYPKEVTQ